MLIIPLDHQFSVQQVYALWNWNSFKVRNFSLKLSNFVGWKNSLEFPWEFLWCSYNSIPLCGTQLSILSLESNWCVMCQMVTTGAVLEGGWGVFIPQHPDPNDPSSILNVNGGNMYWIRKSKYNILGSKILTWHLCVTKAWKWARIYQFSGWLDRCIFFTICLISKFQKMSLSRKFNSKVETKNDTKLKN